MENETVEVESMDNENSELSSNQTKSESKEEVNLYFKYFLVFLFLYLFNFTKLFYISILLVVGFHGYNYYIDNIESKHILKKTE